MLTGIVRPSFLPERITTANLSLLYLYGLSAQDFVNRVRAGLSEVQAAGRLRVSLATYRRIESGEEPPSWEAWDAMCRVFGWPQTFTRAR